MEKRIKLIHVRNYDDGFGEANSFALGSPMLRDESGRLIGDLALLTRPYGDIESRVDFDAAERLAEQALQLIIERVDWIIDQLGIAEGTSGDQMFWPWFEGNGGLLRKPSRYEVVNLEGESRLLYDAIGESYMDSTNSIRVLAAFGVFCCERALDAETRKHFGTTLEMYAAAGVLLGHANYLLGCMTGDLVVKNRYKRSMSERGRRRWEGDPTQAAKLAMFAEWERWQSDRSKYKKPADFRAKVLSDHGSVVNEGTLKNWMTEWRRNAKPSPS